MLTQRMYAFRSLTYLTLLPLLCLAGIGSSFSQDITIDTDDTTLPIGEAVKEQILELEIKASTKIVPTEPVAGEPFQYVVTISWEGSANWVSIDAPNVEWPKHIEQTKVSQGVTASAGEDGPIASKWFEYTLVGATAGTYSLPSIDIDVIPMNGEKLTVDAPGDSITIAQRVPTVRERTGSLLQERGLLIGGVSSIVLVALIIGFIKWKRSQTVEEAVVVDPWEGIDEGVEKAAALRSSGQVREYYSGLESVLGQAIGLYLGRNDAKLSSLLEDDALPEMIRDESNRLAHEIDERKYRPDQPRPEEIDRSLRQLRTIVKTLKEQQPTGGMEE